MLGEVIGLGLIGAAKALGADAEVHRVRVRQNIVRGQRQLDHLDRMLRHTRRDTNMRAACQSLWRMWSEADRSIAVAIENARWVELSNHDKSELGDLAARFTEFEQRIADFCHG